MEANRRAIELASAYFITADGTVKIPLPYKRGEAEVLPGETFEDFGKIERLWGYTYSDERKKELYDMFIQNGGDLENATLPVMYQGIFSM